MAIATTRQSGTQSSPASGIVKLRRALATADPAFTFAPGPAANTLVGQSADGLARVELVGNRATLVLPTSGQGELTMAQVVYTRQFLAIAAPDISTQPWLFEALRAAQRNQPLPAKAPITLSAEAGALSVTVTAQP